MATIARPLLEQEQLPGALLYSYDLVQKLAHGGNTAVYEVISARGRLRGRHLALKKVLPTSNIASSASLHRALCHPNVVALHSIVESSSSEHLDDWHILEFCSEGNLADLMRSRNSAACSGVELRQIVKGVANALVYLKEERIIHRNIDSTNILLGQGCKPKICDFKHAIRVHPTKKYMSQPLMGTVHPAPELQSTPCQYDFAVDAWSFGCVLYICIGGTIDKISNLKFEGSFSMSPAPPTEFKSLVLSLLTAAPDMRLKAEQIAKHAYLAIDHSTSLSDFSREPSRSSSATHTSFPSKANSARPASVAISPNGDDSHAAQKIRSQCLYEPSPVAGFRKRVALRDIGNIPLPYFLQSQLSSTKGSSSNSAKLSSNANTASRPTSNNSQITTFVSKQVEKVSTPSEDASVKFRRTILPIGTTRPVPIDTSALTPKTHKLANGTITILVSRALLVDFRQNQRRHGLKGDQIMLIESTGISIFDAPHLSVPSCLMEPNHRYSLTDLPPEYWKQYNDAANFVDLIRRKIPHVTVYGSEAKCTLMSNPSPSDIEIILYAKDSSPEKTKARSSKAKLHTPVLRVQYSRQRHSLELAQRLIGDRGTEWKKEQRTCLDSSDISRILLLDDTNQLARKGLSMLMDFLKTCDHIEAPMYAKPKQSALMSLTDILPVSASKAPPVHLASSSWPFVCDKLFPFDDSRYLESVGWCVQRRANGPSLGSVNYLYHILFQDGSSLLVDLDGNNFLFSSSKGELIRCEGSDHGQHPPGVRKYARHINEFVSLF